MHTTPHTEPSPARILGKTLGTYSIGMGDRFGHQGGAQLRAVRQAREQGVVVAPVWNKSNREHKLVGTEPGSVRQEADAATREAGWTDPYFVDADHINLTTVDAYLESSDFFTIDVADEIEQPPTDAELEACLAAHRPLLGELSIPGLETSISITPARIEEIATRYLRAVREAGRIYRRIVAGKVGEEIIVEISMDETVAPQSPAEMFFILAFVAEEGIPVRTIAPKFSGRFNKGVDYVGDPAQFTAEFEQYCHVLREGIRRFGLPSDLKLSIHSGSDKFSIYPGMRRVMRQLNLGIHLKTAGTTWLEELAAIIASGAAGASFGSALYTEALQRYDELCAPYLTVLDIDVAALPAPEQVVQWTPEAFARALLHDQACADFNPHLRQLMHVAFRLAAEHGPEFNALLDLHAEQIGVAVTHNLFEKHIRPLFCEG